MGASVRSEERLVKQPTESLLFACDFTNVLQGSDLLSGTPTVTALPSGLTIASIVIASGSLKVNARISSGTDLTEYTVVFTCDDDASNTHVIDCLLAVVD
jgi:hypothetical protein